MTVGRPAEAIGAFPKAAFTLSGRCSARRAEFGERAAVPEPESSCLPRL